MNIKFENVSAGYGSRSKYKEILKDISFEIAEGESVSLLGANGSGKTTLLKVFAGLLPYTGSVKINGRELRELKRSEIAGLVSFLTQLHETSFAYTVYETVMMGRYLDMKGPLSGPGEADRNAVDKALETGGLTDIRDKYITELSGGQLQRVFLARAIARETPALLLDEPANFLDLKYQKQFEERIKSWKNEKGHTLIAVFHDLTLALDLTERIIFLKDGSIVADGPVKESMKAEILEKVYDCNVLSYMDEKNSLWKRFL